MTPAASDLPDTLPEMPILSAAPSAIAVHSFGVTDP